MMQAAEEGWACDEVAKWRVKPFATAQAEAAVMETALLHLSSPTALLEAAPRVWTENRRSPWATLYLRGMQSRLAALSRMYHAAEPQAVSVQDLAMLKMSSAKPTIQADHPCFRDTVEKELLRCGAKLWSGLMKHLQGDFAEGHGLAVPAVPELSSKPCALTMPPDWQHVAQLTCQWVMHPLWAKQVPMSSRHHVFMNIVSILVAILNSTGLLAHCKLDPSSARLVLSVVVGSLVTQSSHRLMRLDMKGCGQQAALLLVAMGSGAVALLPSDVVAQAAKRLLFAALQNYTTCSAVFTTVLQLVDMLPPPHCHVPVVIVAAASGLLRFCSLTCDDHAQLMDRVADAVQRWPHDRASCATAVFIATRYLVGHRGGHGYVLCPAVVSCIQKAVQVLIGAVTFVHQPSVVAVMNTVADVTATARSGLTSLVAAADATVLAAVLLGAVHSGSPLLAAKVCVCDLLMTLVKACVTEDGRVSALAAWVVADATWAQCDGTPQYDEAVQRLWRAIPDSDDGVKAAGAAAVAAPRGCAQTWWAGVKGALRQGPRPEEWRYPPCRVAEVVASEWAEGMAVADVFALGDGALTADSTAWQPDLADL